MTGSDPRPPFPIRRRLMAGSLVLALGVAGPALADYVDSVRNQLIEQGYRSISVSTTLLGRSKIVAQGKSGVREIILNPRTGEILRDQWTSAQTGAGPSIVGSGVADEDGEDKDSEDKDGKGHGRGGDDGGGDDGDGGGDDRGGGESGDGDGGGGDGGGGDGGGGDD